MIDTMLFVADIPAGTPAIGDKVTFTQIAGPKVVRDGLGTPTLKSINTGALTWHSGSKPNLRYSVKNSNWNDPLYNGASAITDANGLNENSTGYQNGNNCALQVNSAFEVSAEFYQSVTASDDNTVFVSIDIEYSGLPGVQDPRGEQGTPCSLVYDFASVPSTPIGAFTTGTWTELSFDNFKAGYRYLMQKVSMQVSVGTGNGFVKFSGGASMGGLSRILPMTSLNSAVGKVITYTAPEVKGPFTIGLMVYDAQGTADIGLTCDYVKRG